MNPRKFLKFLSQRSWPELKTYYKNVKIQENFSKNIKNMKFSSNLFYKKILNLSSQDHLKIREFLSHNPKLFSAPHFSKFLVNLKFNKTKLSRIPLRKITEISVHYSKETFKEDLIQKCVKDMSYLPTLYLYHPFLQSVYNVMTLEKYDINFEREFVTLPDQGQISLDWSAPKQEMSEKKILFILHGLTGGSEMPYVQSLVNESLKEGFKTVVFHNRGINKTYLTTPEPFNGIKLDDLDYAVNHIQDKFKDYSIYGVGLSLGGNLMVRYAAEKKDKIKFKALVAIATPFDIEICVNNLSWIYQRFFLKRYIEQTVIPNLDVLKILEETHGLNFEKIMKTRNLMEFHENFTVKVFGYKNALEYFRMAKIDDNHIKNICIPTLLLHARDDPITSIKCVPFEEIKKNKHIVYAETKYGGHVCWFFGNKPQRWYPKPTVEFLKSFKFDSQIADQMFHLNK